MLSSISMVCSPMLCRFAGANRTLLCDNAAIANIAKVSVIGQFITKITNTIKVLIKTVI